MNVFFDTEFTGLHRNTTLISIGLVSDNNKRFYAELTDYDESQIDDWVRKHVINNLLLKEEYVSESEQYCKGNRKYVAEKITEWLAQFDKVQLVSDVCHYDMMLFIDLFGSAFDLPSNVSPTCVDINQLISERFKITNAEAFDMNREDIVQRPIVGDKHNALYDALVIKEVFNVVTRPYVKYIKG